MDKQVVAISENGSFRPLESVELEEHRRVLLKISEVEDQKERSRPDLISGRRTPKGARDVAHSKPR